MTELIIKGIAEVLAQAIPAIIDIWSLKDNPALSKSEVSDEITRIIKAQRSDEAKEEAAAKASA